MSRFLLVSLALFCASVNLVSSLIEILDNQPIVNIENGELAGIYAKSRDGRTFASFKGIPYANPPDRFKVNSKLYYIL